MINLGNPTGERNLDFCSLEYKKDIGIRGNLSLRNPVISEGEKEIKDHTYKTICWQITISTLLEKDGIVTKIFLW
jgi:hypothetical protein